MKTFKLARTAVAALALCAGFAQAGPVVTDWLVSDTATFVPGTALPNGGNPSDPVLSNSNQTLTWGVGNPRSSLVINNSANGGSPYSVPTGTLTNTIAITHNNYPITGNSLTSVDILGTLVLQGVLPLPAGSVFGPVQLTFGIKFYETPNSGSGGVCAGGGPVPVSGCPDLFVVDDESINSPFVYDGNPYYLSVFANGFNTLPDSVCAALNVDNGCRGFVTAEDQSSTAQFKLLITSTPYQVPEPGSLALMGLGLGSLGWIARRRKQQQG